MSELIRSCVIDLVDMIQILWSLYRAQQAGNELSYWLLASVQRSDKGYSLSD